MKKIINLLKRAGVKVTAAIKWMILPTIIGMLLALPLIQLHDRFSGEDYTFYSEDANMTCQVVAEHGPRLIYCLPGRRGAFVKDDAQ